MYNPLEKSNLTYFLLECLSNFIYYKLLEDRNHGFFTNKRAGISESENYYMIIKHLTASLKRDFITQSNSIFFDKSYALFKTIKYRNCEKFKEICDNITIQRHCISAHKGELDQNKIKKTPELKNLLISEDKKNRSSFLGYKKCTDVERDKYFGNYIKSEEDNINNSTYDHYAEIIFAKSHKDKNRAKEEIKKLEIDKLYNSSYFLSWELELILIMIKLYDEYLETNYINARFNFPLLSKYSNTSKYYLDQFFNEKSKSESICFEVLESIHKSRLADFICPICN
jgi:hypothetical protein